MLTAALAAAALIAGLAGAWSPCGFSMVETLAPGGYAGRVRTAVAGTGAFALGALAGGLATFGGLALLGSWLGVGGGAAAAVAIGVLLAAAAGDAAGRRIVPQVRRQVPESWRRVLPVPLAAGLYGVLLGLGFTTFVLSLTTYALAAACLALGAPAAGIAVGLAFGAGRAIPVAILAPLQDRERPAAIAAAMAERPSILRGLRAAAAAAGAAAALVLAVAPPPAHAAQVFARSASDPSAAADGLVAWDSGGQGIVRRGGENTTLPGSDPAVAPGRVAYLADGQIVVADAGTLEPLVSFAAPGAEALGLSRALVAWRALSPDGRDAIYARDLAAPAEAPPLHVATARRGAALGRPAVAGRRVVFDVQSSVSSRILEVDTATRARRTLRYTRVASLVAPSVERGRLLYVRSTALRQQVRIGRLAGGRERIVYSTYPTARRDSGHEPGRHPHHQGYPHGKRPKLPPRPPKGVTVTLWNTALSGSTGYVTRLRHVEGGVTKTSILRVRAR